MKAALHTWQSRHLDREMTIAVYGTGGRTLLAFPPARGSHDDYERHGMVEAIRPVLDQEKVRLVTVDSVDAEAWLDEQLPPAERGRRADAYDRYLIEEVVPFIREQGLSNGKLIAVGCNFGALHAANLLFRHPDVADTLIALDGVYRLTHILGDTSDETVYLHSPLFYLPNLTDPWYLNQLRASRIIICVGQGHGEEVNLLDTRALADVLFAKAIPAWIDYWGFDVTHDWAWWRKQLPYFLSYLKL